MHISVINRSAIVCVGVCVFVYIHTYIYKETNYTDKDKCIRTQPCIHARAGDKRIDIHATALAYSRTGARTHAPARPRRMRPPSAGDFA